MKTMRSGESILKEGMRLVASGAAGQAVAFLLIAVIGRQYHEDAMGVLGSFLSWGGVLAIVATGHYEQGIVVGKSEQDSHALYHLSLRISLVFILFLLPIAILMGGFFPDKVPMGRAVALLPLYILLMAWYNASLLWELRHKRYRRIARVQVIKGVGNNVLKVLFGFIAATVGSLIAAQIFSISAAFSILCRSVKQGLKAPPRLFLRQTARRYQGFPKYGLLQAVIDSLLGSVLVLALPLRFGLAEVGFLTMAIMLARSPLLLISDNLSKVYFQKISERVSARGSIKPLVRRLLLCIALIGIPAALLLGATMSGLVTIVVGERWLPSAYIISWMLPMCIPNFANAILNTLPDIFARQRQNMWAQIILLATDVVIIAIGFACFDFRLFIPFFYLWQVVGQTGYLIFLLRFVRNYERSIIPSGAIGA